MSEKEKRELEIALLEKARDLMRYAEERNAIPRGGFLSMAAFPDHICVTIHNGFYSSGTGTPLLAWADPRNEKMEVQRA